MIKQTYCLRAASVIAALMAVTMTSARIAHAREGEGVQWHQMDQLCGSIVSVVPIKKVIRRPNGKSETLLYENPMKGVTVTLYKAEGENAVCCSVATKLGEIVTDHNGRFRFADYAGGYYWLAVQFKGGEARVPIKTNKYEKRACEAPNMDRVIFADASPKPKVEVRII